MLFLVKKMAVLEIKLPEIMSKSVNFENLGLVINISTCSLKIDFNSFYFIKLGQ
jgi:hypothetical protein